MRKATTATARRRGIATRDFIAAFAGGFLGLAVAATQFERQPPRESRTEPTAVLSLAAAAFVPTTAPPARREPLPIAIVVTGLGPDRARTARAIALPAEVTLAFLAHAPELRPQTDAARDAGHELLLQIAMEAGVPGADAASSALTLALSPQRLRERLQWSLGRFDGYAGVTHQHGGRFLADRTRTAQMLAEVQRRGLYFLDMIAIPPSLGVSVAREIGVPVLARDVVLDNEETPDYVGGALRRTEEIAARNGRAVAVMQARDIALSEIETWLADGARRGFAVVRLGRLQPPPVAVAETIRVLGEAGPRTANGPTGGGDGGR